MFFWDMLKESLDGTCHEDFSGGDRSNMRNPRSNFNQNGRNMADGSAYGNSRAVGSSPNLSRPPVGQQRQGGQGGQQRQGGQDGQNPRTRGSGNDSGSYGAWSSKPPPNARPNGSPPGNGRGQNMPRANQGSQYEPSRPEANRQQSPRQAQPKQAPGKGNGRQQQSRKEENETRDLGNRRQQQSQNETRDTVIGRGFTAAMKRGVAQAKPTTDREQLQQQPDGGFISTIQRGFEGLFGKPTSKEEVLRKRGPVFANEYEAVPGDEVDQKVQYFARRLPEDVAGCLKIFRERKGEYQINDEIVNMEQKYRQAPNGQTETEIFVFWEIADGQQSDPEPLGEYLTHAANVAFEVAKGGNVITQVPDHARMSFRDEVGTKITDGSADARFNAMEVAARQAKMREEAAAEWREKQNKPNKGRDYSQSPPQSPRGRHDAKFGEEEVSIVDQALQAIGIMPAAHTYAAPAAAPAPAPYMMPPATTQAMAMPVGAPPQAGYLMPQHQAMPRQGTMYAYGSAAPMAGYPQMAQMGSLGVPPGGLRPSHASMYSSGSAYGGFAVPVR